MKSPSVQSIIMRRVYYSFTLSLVTHPAFVAGAVFVMSAYAVKELVHVARVWEHFLSVPVGRLPEFAFNLVTHSEAATLLATTAMMVSLLYVARLMVHARPLSFGGGLSLP